MRKNHKYLVPMDDDIHDFILYSLINWKNALIREGRYTDAIDDALIKFLNAKRKYIKFPHIHDHANTGVVFFIFKKRGGNRMENKKIKPELVISDEREETSSL